MCKGFRKKSLSGRRNRKKVRSSGNAIAMKEGVVKKTLGGKVNTSEKSPAFCGRESKSARAQSKGVFV